MQSFTVDGRLPNLNEYTAACRGNRFRANTLKHKVEDAIAAAALQQGVEPVDEPVWLQYTWYEQNTRRDKDNVAFAQKFVQDALVKAGILQGDGWAHVLGFSHCFAVDKERPRVQVDIIRQSEKE